MTCTDGDQIVTGDSAKPGLRRAALARRAALDPAERAAASAAIEAAVLAAVLAVVTGGGAAVIAAYIPLRSEPGTMAMLDALSVRATVVVPVLQADGDLDWAAWTGADDLAPAGPRGRMLRPIGPTLGASFLQHADLLLVPALLVARDGARLGRGGGSYDRALRRAAPAAPIAALLFDGELVDRLPAQPWDVPVTAAVTPGGGWTDLAR